MKKSIVEILSTALIFITVTLVTITSLSCNDQEKAKHQALSHQQELSRRKSFLIEQLLMRKCRRIQNQQGQKRFDYLEDVDIRRDLTYRISGYNICQGTFNLQLPSDPDDPERDPNLENYNFTEVVVLDSNKHRVSELFFTRDTLLRNQDVRSKQFLLVLDFKYEEYDADSDAFVFTYFIVNPLERYREHFIELTIKRNGSFFFEDRGSLALQ